MDEIEREREACTRRDLCNSEFRQEAKRANRAEDRFLTAERERDEARLFLDNAVSKAPEPLRALGEYLGRLLHEDQWPEAERYLNAALTIEQTLAKAVEVIKPFARQNLHKNEDGSHGILVPATVADVRNARAFIASLKEQPDG